MITLENIEKVKEVQEELEELQHAFITKLMEEHQHVNPIPMVAAKNKPDGIPGRGGHLLLKSLR